MSYTKIDLNVLSELKTLENPGENLIQTIIDLYFKSSEEKIHDLPKFLKEKNYSGLKNIAHSLKSGSYRVGAMGLASMCEKLENLANESTQLNSLFEIVANLQEEYKLVQKELLDYSHEN